jgi:hypothetical protein
MLSRADQGNHSQASALMTGEIVEFPGREPPAAGYSEPYIDKLHSEAFRDLEGSICDCEIMARIAAQLMSNARSDDDELVFVVFHVSQMLTALKADYHARWHGEKRGTS